jgi:peptidoglycan/LPS O-acetylase OafA/YrhL
VNYRRDIDGLRAIAVVSVLVFHFDLVPFGSGGFTGVDVFFVISGYLITTINKPKIDAGEFLLLRFYLNRVRRLAPALFATLVMVTVAGIIWLFPTGLLGLEKEILAAQAYVANIYYWRTISYFGLGSDSAFLLHTWSLGVEEQFYLVYPILLIALQRYGGRFVWIAVAALVIISFCLNVAFVAGEPDATFYLLPTRAWELLIGALVVLASAKLSTSRVTNEVLGVCGIALLLISFFAYSKNYYFPGFFSLLPTSGAALIIFSGRDPCTGVSRALTLGGMRYVGNISYPLYLVHWPVKTFGLLLLPGYGLATRLGMLGLSLVLAAIIYHGLETPLRKARWSAQQLALTYLAGVSMTAMCFVAVIETNGIPHRFSLNALRLATYVSSRSPELNNCQFKDQNFSPSSICVIGDTKKREPTWLIFGDSHAWAAYGAFDEWLSKSGQSAFFFFRQSCPPLLGIHLVHDGKCFKFNNTVFQFLKNNPSIKNVLLVSTWREAIEGLLSTSENSYSTVDQSTTIFSEQFHETIKSLRELNKSVVVWEPLPGARRVVPIALARGETGITYTKSEYLSTFKFFFQALDRDRDKIAATISPSAALCASGSCAVTCDDRPCYFDNGHITASSADFWAKVIESSIGH